MKQNSTKGITMLLAVFMLLATSCNKEKEEVTPILPDTPPVEEEKPIEPETPPVETNETCRVTKIVDMHEVYEDTPIELSYNEQGYVSGLNKAETNPDGTTIIYTSTFAYDAKNQLIKKEDYKNGKRNEYTIYEYQNGLKVSAKQYKYIEGSAEGELLNTKTYRYDEHQRVSEISEDLAGSIRYFVTIKYTYDENDNVVKALYYVNDMPSSKILYSDYDDKPTPYSVMKGLLLSDEDALSKNNVGRRVVFYTHDSEVSTNVSYIWSFTYEYDSNGYPAKITRIDDMRDKDVRVFTYDCK